MTIVINYSLSCFTNLYDVPSSAQYKRRYLKKKKKVFLENNPMLWLNMCNPSVGLKKITHHFLLYKDDNCSQNGLVTNNFKISFLFLCACVFCIEKKKSYRFEIT